MASYKICVGFENNCEKVLKILFQYGYRWSAAGNQKISDHPYIYFDDDNIVRYPSKEISISEFFKMFPEKSVSYKIYVGENYEKVLKRLFQYEYVWSGKYTKEIIKCDYIYFDDKYILRGSSFNSFLEDTDFEEITFSEFFKMFPEKMSEVIQKSIDEKQKLIEEAKQKINKLNSEIFDLRNILNKENN